MNFEDSERRRLSRKVAQEAKRIARSEARSEPDHLQLRDALKRLNASDKPALELSEEVAREIASIAKPRKY